MPPFKRVENLPDPLVVKVQPIPIVDEIPPVPAPLVSNAISPRITSYALFNCATSHKQVSQAFNLLENTGKPLSKGPLLT